jgi:YbbR domain-containing protein
VRVVHFIFRNWALKAGALILAIILYVGMVVLQSTQSWPGPIPIELVNQPANSYLLRTDPALSVTSIRYIASADVSVSGNSFSASLDLTNSKVSATESSLVKVQVVALDQRIQIIGFEPQQIRVTLDPVIDKIVAVRLEPGVVPSGLTMGTKTWTPEEVLVSGPEAFVNRVSLAEARVTIDSSGLDVNTDVSLIPVDASRNTVDNVTLTPSSTHVTIQIGSQLRTETVAVSPVVRGSPATGYYVSSIDVNPSVVSVTGNANALAPLNGKISTEAIALTGATGDISVKVALDLPAGVEAPDVTTITVTIHLTSPAATRSVSIGVVPQGASPDLVYTLSTPSVTVTIGGASAALDAFDTSTLVGVVSVGDLAPGTYTLTVAVTVPPGIKVVAVNPAQVTVTVTLPPSASPSPSPLPTPTPTPL